MHMTPTKEMRKPHSMATGPPETRTTDRLAAPATQELRMAKAMPRIESGLKREVWACWCPPTEATSSNATSGLLVFVTSDISKDARSEGEEKQEEEEKKGQ